LILPPYLHNLSAVELIWADVKQWIAGKNTAFKVQNVELLCCQIFAGTEEKWKAVCPRVETVENTYY
jgi:hypothetical protein